MKYRGYEAIVAFDAEDRIFHGRLLCTQDVVSFEADNVDGLEREFHEAVDDYLEQCAASGRPPDKAFSGKLVVRMPAMLHRSAYIEAAKAGVSLNAWITESLEAKVHQGRKKETYAHG